MAKAEQLITEHLELWTSAIKAKSSAGRGANKKIHLYGLVKLRELILNLAVRGMITEQNPQDEPAAKLLEKIEEKKDQLVKQKLLRKQKVVPPITAEEEPYCLPPGWEWARLGAICTKITDGSHNPPPNSGAGFPMLSSQNIYSEKIDFSSPSRYLSEEDFKTEDQRTNIQPFDVLLNIVASIGRSAVVPLDAPKFALQRSVAVLSTNIDPHYLSKILISSLCRSYYEIHAKGTAQKGIYLGKLSLMPLAIPPLAEQHRIVAKVDELMALCDQLEQEQEHNLQTHEALVSTLLDALTSAAGDASQFADAWQRINDNFDILFTTESSIDQLKQAILQLAVMGKLVPQNSEDESASTLLNKVADERDRQAKKQKRLAAIPANAEPYRIPESWKWCQLGELSISSDSGWSPQCDPSTRENEDQWGVLKVSAVSWGEFRANEHKKLPDGLKPRPECEVHNGDFLLSRANTEDLVARGVVVEQAAPRLMMSDKIVRFTLSSYISKSYVNLANDSIFSRDHYKQNSSGTSSSMKNVSRETMSKLPIPLPPLAEQNRIVAKVDELMALCDQLKASLNSAQETQLNLADSIVEQAVQSPA